MAVPKKIHGMNDLSINQVGDLSFSVSGGRIGQGAHKAFRSEGNGIVLIQNKPHPDQFYAMNPVRGHTRFKQVGDELFPAE
jgi:hypothetical protein